MSIKSLRLLAFALILCRARSLCQNRIDFTVLALMGNVYLADFTRTSFGLEVPEGCPKRDRGLTASAQHLKARLAIH